MSIFEKSWAQVWANLGLKQQPDLFEALLAAYNEPQRHYHSQQHLSECLAHFDQARHLAEHPGEVEIALWFHDAIYDVRGKSNERLSADWAVRALLTSNASEATQRRVEQLIMATKHDVTPTRSDEQLLVDIDLSILGATPERFAEYDRQVRAEYSWVPGFVYNMKRRSVLKSFLARPNIYSTSYFRERNETQARINLMATV
ncbi:N-methyl-D-aspartate receptor NMDAR2C subunit [Pseudomonas leptonychotis]|uniref:HD domain-containing protein n=1 Tax=Pseudomonas leptonychotis TaxID=2448482 RepID=UPI00386457ED